MMRPKSLAENKGGSQEMAAMMLNILCFERTPLLGAKKSFFPQIQGLALLQNKVYHLKH